MGQGVAKWLERTLYNIDIMLTHYRSKHVNIVNCVLSQNEVLHPVPQSWSLRIFLAIIDIPINWGPIPQCESSERHSFIFLHFFKYHITDIYWLQNVTSHEIYLSISNNYI